jgi:hypothetical protein
MSREGLDGGPLERVAASGDGSSVGGFGPPSTSRRFVVRATAWTHSPGATVGEESQRSTRIPRLVVVASGRPLGSKRAGTGTWLGGGSVGQGKGAVDGVADAAGEASEDGDADGDCASAAGPVAKIATRTRTVARDRARRTEGTPNRCRIIEIIPLVIRRAHLGSERPASGHGWYPRLARPPRYAGAMGRPRGALSVGPSSAMLSYSPTSGHRWRLRACRRNAVSSRSPVRRSRLSHQTDLTGQVTRSREPDAR